MEGVFAVEKELEQIVQKAIKGDQTALETLLRMKMKKIYAIARMLTDENNYEDAAQDALYNIVKYIHTVQKAAYFDTWMYRVIKNACATKTKKMQAVQQVDILTEDEEMDADYFNESKYEFLPEEFLLQKEKCALVIHCVEALPEQYKEVLVLKHFQGLSPGEISRTLRIPTKKVYNSLARARKYLKQALETATGERLAFVAVPMGSAGMLSQILFAGSELAVCPYVLEAASANVTGLVSAGLQGAVHGAVACGGLAAVKAISVMTAAAVTVTGITLAVSLPRARDMPEAPVSSAGQVNAAIGEAQEASADEISIPLEILTLKDMIGAGEAEMLEDMAQNGTTQLQLQAFLAEIGAENVRMADDGDVQFAVYSVQKQEMLLVLSCKITVGAGAQVRYTFGKQGEIEIPDGMDLVLMFQ